MKFSEYCQYDAIGLAELIQSKQITPQELLNDVISFTESINPKINAINNKMYDEAENTIKKGIPTGPFYGVPFLLKDLGALYAGTVTSNGSRFYQHFVPDHDSEVVKRYRQTGLVIFGKTNVPELGLAFTTEPFLFGPTKNPWQLDRTAGGSSGGTAAAVAARLIPVAHASDGGGSIRVPASCCGVFGIKPTRARVPMGPDFGEGWAGLASTNVISVSVRDSAALLDATQGPELGDPYYAPPITRPFLEEIKNHPGKLKIAYSADFIQSISVHDDCRQAMLNAVKLCESLGHELEEAYPQFDQLLMALAMRVITSASAKMIISLREKMSGKRATEEDLEPITWKFAQIGKKYGANDYANAVFILHLQTRVIARFFSKYDVLLTPTLAQPPIKLGTFTPYQNDFDDYFRQQFLFSPFTGFWNQTGQPAMSVPLFWNSEQLPIGVQFVGRFGDEATLFRLAAQLEQASPWKDKIPKVI
jgi:Asp-tRNA(Asn)/Glu-tRNA(Gln) amidotransferase A subunit family amidase